MKNNKRIMLLVSLVTLTLLAISFLNSDTPTPANSVKPTVAVSIIPQQTFVKAVAGDLVDVTTIIPPGFSPANYQPSPQEIIAISNSDIYFSIGVPAEKSYILPLITEHNHSLRVVELAKKVEEIYLPLYLNSDQDSEKIRDPHIWLSPLRVKIMIKVISDELCRIDPHNEAVYKANAISYINKLHELHGSIMKSLSNLAKRSFISYHPAFSYFANDYNLRMIAIEANGKEATVKRLQNIIDLAADEGIKYVFYQDEFDNHQAKVIAEEINGKVIKTSPLADNYLSNIQAIADKLAISLK